MSFAVDSFSEGQLVEGIVRSVNDFGVFCDIGGSRDALLPWSQVAGCGPGADEVLPLVITKVDGDRQRIFVGTPGRVNRVWAGGSRGSARGRGASGPQPNTDQSRYGPVGGFVYDVVLGARPRRKGGKGDGRGCYTYGDGMLFSDLMVGDDVSGHITNIEREGCWIDIAAMRDGFLPWQGAPRSSSRWQVGDMIDDLKLVSVNDSEILLAWDDEGISSFAEKDLEKLFAEGPPLPPQGDPYPALAVGDNCCALYGETSARLGPGVAQGLEHLHSQERALLQGTKDALSMKGGRGTGNLVQGSGGTSADAHEVWGETIGKGRSKEACKGQGRGKPEASSGVGLGEPLEGSGEAMVRAPSLRAASVPAPETRRVRPVEDLAIGEIVRGRVTGLSRAGALVDIGCEAEGLVPRAFVTLQCRRGQVIRRLKVMGTNAAAGKVTLEPLEEDDPGENPEASR